MFRSKNQAPCAWPGCKKRGDFCRGLCSRHYQEFRRRSAEHESEGRGAETIVIRTRPPWTYAGREDDLLAEQEKRNGE